MTQASNPAVPDLFLGETARRILDAINACATDAQLDHAGRDLLWPALGAGLITDDEATHLGECLERRRSSRRSVAPASSARALPRLSRFAPRQRPRSPDREASRNRRRVLGGSSALPDTLRHHYTEGQRAVLCIIAGEVKRQGMCDLPIDKIGALAGVCRTTVQTALHEARRLGHLRITERPREGRKHLTNVVEIVSREWRAWLQRSGSAAPRRIGSNPSTLASPTKNEGRKEGAGGRADAPLRRRDPPPDDARRREEAA